ncbi:piercer of microtubule wall 1 protein [Aethina tumida]|uniref:piercer of microtubule wall 1 protein n=1 Tax=Aethina tumida TaxID=116153 RepID=UPI00096B4FB2|nr:piercer of microtubule wall 1 protein [Aethina tumida]
MDCSKERVGESEKTSDYYRTTNLPQRFDNPMSFYGYGTHRRPQEHAFYKTTSSEYGRIPPSIHSVPTKYFPKNQVFSKTVAHIGPYRNYSLNTGIDIHL